MPSTVRLRRAPRTDDEEVHEFASTLGDLANLAIKLKSLAPTVTHRAGHVQSHKWSLKLQVAGDAVQEIRLALEGTPGDGLNSLSAASQGSFLVQRAIKSHELLEPQSFTEKLHWTRQALSKALKANRVFFIEAQGNRYFPAFFTDARHERRHLELVSRTLGYLPGGSKWLFFTTPKGSLSGLTPIEALDKGQLTKVKATAERFANA